MTTVQRGRNTPTSVWILSRKRRDGRMGYRLRWISPLTGKTESEACGTDKVYARSRREEKRLELRGILSGSLPDHTLDELIQAVPAFKAGKSPNTVRVIKTSIEALVGLCGDRLLARADRAFIMDFRAKRLAEDVSPATCEERGDRAEPTMDQARTTIQAGDPWARYANSTHRSTYGSAKSMRHALPWICLAGIFTGCSRQTPQSPSVAPSDIKYADFLVNAQNHSFRRIGGEVASSRSKLVPNSVFGIFDVVDTNGWKCDRVSVRNGVVHDWNQYKLIADTSVGPLVLHQRFMPGNPGGNPWDEILLAPSTGEAGVAVDSLPGHLVCERIYMIYLFESGGLLTASYGSKGKLIGMSARHDANASFRYSDLNANSPFDMYELPENVDDSAMQPPLNEALRRGIGKITLSTTYPALDKLINIFVVGQYDVGRLFTVRTLNASGITVTSRIMKFNTRPYDRAILAASQSAG